jgi:hypothetical protein
VGRGIGERRNLRRAATSQGFIGSPGLGARATTLSPHRSLARPPSRTSPSLCSKSQRNLLLGTMSHSAPNRLVWCVCCEEFITAAAARNHLEGRERPAAAATKLLTRNRPPSPKIAGARRPERRPPAKKRRTAAPTENTSGADQSAHATGADEAGGGADSECLTSRISERKINKRNSLTGRSRTYACMRRRQRRASSHSGSEWRRRQYYRS